MRVEIQKKENIQWSTGKHLNDKIKWKYVLLFFWLDAFKAFDAEM